VTAKQKSAYLIEALEALYPETPIPLDHYSPFTLLCAVVLSAQCTDARVNTITPTLFAKADTPEAMAVTSGKSVEQTEKDAKKLFPKERWNKLHLQIIFYGREYSPARGWSLEKDFITRTVLGSKAPKI